MLLKTQVDSPLGSPIFHDSFRPLCGPLGSNAPVLPNIYKNYLINFVVEESSLLAKMKGDVTRDDSQPRLLAQLSVATLIRH